MGGKKIYTIVLSSLCLVVPLAAQAFTTWPFAGGMNHLHITESLIRSHKLWWTSIGLMDDGADSMDVPFSSNFEDAVNHFDEQKFAPGHARMITRINSIVNIAHDLAFQQAVQEVKPLFHQCAPCGSWVDEICWSKAKNHCTECVEASDSARENESENAEEPPKPDKKTKKTDCTPQIKSALERIKTPRVICFPLPGESLASPQLQKDAWPMALAMAAKSKNQLCPTKSLNNLFVVNTSVATFPRQIRTKLSFRLSNWEEFWYINTCGEITTVIINFIPDANGTGTTFVIKPYK